MDNKKDKIITVSGICCFCGFACNPLSQSCGTCVRNINGHYMGLNSGLNSILISNIINEKNEKKKK
jgi:hypothetical protein